MIPADWFCVESWALAGKAAAAVVAWKLLRSPLRAIVSYPRRLSDQRYEIEQVQRDLDRSERRHAELLQKFNARRRS